MDLKNGVFHGRPAYWLAILVLLAGLLLSLLWAVTFGSVDLKMGDVYRVILYKVTEALHFPVGDSEVYGSGSMSDIVWFVRLPRLVLAIGVGMALALAGVVMQAIVKNPLADPYVLGVSSGASLGATLAILVGVGSFLGSGYVGLVAFAGAFLVSMGVIALANIGGRATSVKLILAGTALSAICAAVSNFFLYVINTSSGALEAVVRWTMGSLAAASWDTNLWMLAVSVLGALFFWTQYRTLNLMLLGRRGRRHSGNRSSSPADCLSPGGVPAGGLCGLYGGHHRLCGAGYSPYGTHSLWNGPQKADSHQRLCWGQSSFCGPMYSAGWCSRARRSPLGC